MDHGIIVQLKTPTHRARAACARGKYSFLQILYSTLLRRTSHSSRMSLVTLVQHALWWFNITVTNLRKLKSHFLSKPFTVQLGTRVLTNFEIKLAPSLLNFVRQAVPVPLVFLNYYRPGLLFTDFGDAKTLVRWTQNHIGLLLSLRC
jgi:hypothetical protein